MNRDTLTDTQKNELVRLKQYFPYRIVFGVVDKDSGEFTSYALPTKHLCNKKVREGHSVFVVT